MFNEDISRNKAYTICICDDDPIILDLIYNTLLNENYDVIKFQNPYDLLKYYKQNYALIDILIFDYIMDINGYDLYLECLKIFKTPLIVISSQIDIIDIDKFNQLSCNHILSKPLNFNILIDAINEEINKRSEVDERIGLSLIGGYNSLYKKIKKSFYNTYYNYKNQFDKLIKENNIEKLRLEIHKIKGISLNISQIKLYHITKLLNYYLKQNTDFEKLKQFYLEFEITLNNTLKYLELESEINDV